jgi:hypothetical protein
MHFRVVNHGRGPVKDSFLFKVAISDFGQVIS